MIAMLTAAVLPAPGHFGEGAEFIGARVAIVGSIYTGEVVGWYGSEKYTVKIDRRPGEDAALAGAQKVAAYEYTELALIAPAERSADGADGSDHEAGEHRSAGGDSRDGRVAGGRGP